MMTPFWRNHLLWPLIILAILFYILDGLGVDFMFTDPFFNAVQGKWTYKHSWWANDLIHQGGRALVMTLAASCLLLFLLSLARGSLLSPYRRIALYLLLCIGLSTGLASAGKALTHRHCPKEYVRYGGPVPYTPILSFARVETAADLPTGRCFPAGHASGGFSLVALYFIFYRRSRFWAYVGLGSGLLLGSIFTFGQLVRGAHFISHSVATLALCWLISLLLSPLLLNKPSDAVPVETT